jgi:predicted glycosyltransferase
MTDHPVLLFYCQHSLGMGHLVRSFALAQALAERFRVVFLNGGKLPRGMTIPQTIEIVSLPPLGMDVEGILVSRDRRRSVERTQARRLQLIMSTFETLRPQAVLIELFPFGRKKFAFELLPLLEAARQSTQPRSLVLCSLRDILVGSRRDQAHHDERASLQANQLFDAILVHADPQFARLEDSFHPVTPLSVPIHYTGFVFAERHSEKRHRQVKEIASPRTAPRNDTNSPNSQTSSKAVYKHPRVAPILVSAGGGLVGASLFRIAVAAHELLWPELRVPMKIIAGPFLPEDDWQALQRVARQQPGVRVRRAVPDMCAEMRSAAVSISQCGYNTALDILRAGTPSLVVPFSEGREDEQLQRARRLDELGTLRMLEPQRLTPATFAEAIRQLFSFAPQSAALNLHGAQNTADLVASLLHQPSVSTPFPATQGVQL